MMPGASKSPEAAEKVNPKPETLNPREGRIDGFGIVGLGFLVGASGLVGVGFRIYGLVYGVQGKGQRLLLFRPATPRNFQGSTGLWSTIL